MRAPWLRETALTVVIAAIAMLALPLLLGGTYTLTVLVIYGMLGLSLGLVWGFGGILCFGQAAFFGLGAYSYAICAVNAGESTLPMIAAVLVPSAFAAVLGAMMFYGRLGDVYLAIITLVVTLILYRFHELDGRTGSTSSARRASAGSTASPDSRPSTSPAIPTPTSGATICTTSASSR